MSTEIATKHNDLKTDLLPKDWDIFDIQTVSTVVGGGTPSTANENNFNGSIPWITPRDLSAHLDRYISQGERSITEEGLNSSNAKLLPAQSVLLTTRAPVGYLAIASNEVTTNQGFHSLIPNEKTNSLFLFYLLKNNIQTLVDNASGSTFQELNGKTLKSLEFAFPKIKEQEKIAEILSSIDDKIELNRKINLNLEKLGSFLFKKWFIDVDNQKIGKVSDLIRVESGFPFHSSMFDENGDYKLVTIKNVQDGFFVPECTDSLSEIPAKVPTHCRLNNGDILLSLTGNVGRVCFVYGENYLLNQRVANLVPIDENNRAFTYFLFRQKEFQNTLIGISRGTAQQNLSPIETKSLEIPIPSQDILDRFADVANPIFQKLVENYNEIKNLSILRDSLLPRLMNGKIRVK